MYARYQPSCYVVFPSPVVPSQPKSHRKHRPEAIVFCLIDCWTPEPTPKLLDAHPHHCMCVLLCTIDGRERLIRN